MLCLHTGPMWLPSVKAKYKMHAMSTYRGIKYILSTLYDDADVDECAMNPLFDSRGDRCEDVCVNLVRHQNFGFLKFSCNCANLPGYKLSENNLGCVGKWINN